MKIAGLWQAELERLGSSNSTMPLGKSSLIQSSCTPLKDLTLVMPGPQEEALSTLTAKSEQTSIYT